MKKDKKPNQLEKEAFDLDSLKFPEVQLIENLDLWVVETKALAKYLGIKNIKALFDAEDFDRLERFECQIPIDGKSYWTVYGVLRLHVSLGWAIDKNEELNEDVFLKLDLLATLMEDVEDRYLEEREEGFGVEEDSDLIEAVLPSKFSWPEPKRGKKK